MTHLLPASKSFSSPSREFLEANPMRRTFVYFSAIFLGFEGAVLYIAQKNKGNT